jgi:hypothetical protein
LKLQGCPAFLKKRKKKILNEIALKITGFSLDTSPPELAGVIHLLVKEITGQIDPYKEIKRNSNYMAIGIYGKLKKKINASNDKLLTAVKLAISGNIIDYGAKNSLNINEELAKIIKGRSGNIKKGSNLFKYLKFKQKVNSAKNILYLADNAGEVLFDRLLLEEIRNSSINKDIIYAVKEEPIINDALKEDAIICGIDKIAKVISSGCVVPATVISMCSKEFLYAYKKADIIISKGQGNYEALSSENRPLFFLLMAKCPVIARDIGCNLGDAILLNRQK